MPPSRSKEHKIEHQIEHKIVIENVSGDLILPGGYLVVGFVTVFLRIEISPVRIIYIVLARV